MRTVDRALAPAPASSGRRLLLGILCVAGAVSVFSVQDVLVKLMSGSYPVHEIVFVRSMVALPLLAAYVGHREGFRFLRGPRLGLHGLRGGCLFLSYITYYLGLAGMPLAEAVAVFFTVPLFIAVLCHLFFGDRVGWRRWAAIIVGFAGALIIVRPGTRLFEPSALLLLAAAIFYATGQLQVRRMAATESGGAMALSSTAVYMLGSALLAAVMAGIEASETAPALRFLTLPWSWPGQGDALKMVACGLMASFCFVLLAAGYRLADANAVAPFEYAALPWGVLWGYLVFGNLPDGFTLVGGALIVGSGLFVIFRERRLARRAANARAPTPS
jgi:drug/metabolite transporter (DMT)-like permease